jgi:paraquat-inducible protein B
MNEPSHSPTPEASLPKAKIKKARPAWLLWLIPLGAALLCVWFVYRDFIATGPVITIYFRNADGIKEDNTPVKYRGTQVGQVKRLGLAQDNQHVKVSVRLAGSAKQLASAGSLFWIVRPELKVGGISGLRTIISGEYIAVEPGEGPQTNSFFAAEKAPLPEQPNALHITLLAPNLSSLQEQSPIFYRGIQVGEVLRYQLGADAREVVVEARIREEYKPLVRLNSKFWNAGGIDFRFSLFRGAQISAESPETLLGGGIEFATPPEVQEPATNGAVFPVYQKAEESWKKWTPAIELRLPEQAPRKATPSNVRLR